MTDVRHNTVCVCLSSQPHTHFLGAGASTSSLLPKKGRAGRAKEKPVDSSLGAAALLLTVLAALLRETLDGDGEIHGTDQFDIDGGQRLDDEQL